MQNYHLVPSEAGHWLLHVEGNGTVAIFPSKAQAVPGSMRLVSERGGSLKIHRADGSFEEERTYPRSADPVGSPG